MSLPDWMVPLWDAINTYVTTCGGDPSKHVYGNTPRMNAVCEVDDTVRRAIDEAVAAEREACAKVADDKAREHVTLEKQFYNTRSYAASRAHEQYARVCNGSDGVAARIRARGAK